MFVIKTEERGGGDTVNAYKYLIHTVQQIATNVLSPGFTFTFIVTIFISVFVPVLVLEQK